MYSGSDKTPADPGVKYARKYAQKNYLKILTLYKPVTVDMKRHSEIFL